MRMKRTMIALTFVAALAAFAHRSDKPATVRALSTSPEEANAAIAELRAAGQAGVDAFAAAGAKLTDRDELARYRAALDRICRQRDCYASRLYWYTDLAEAKRVAHAQHKPILSLRLLGKLDDELSCANSRFFRTTLYSDPRIARAMREGFVLHWSSERPVPTVTIDYGDGRKICNTITGNSAHYLLDADGRPLDVIPGLYSPDAFLEHLGRLSTLAAECGTGDARSAYLRWQHQALLDQLMMQRNAQLQQLGFAPAATPAKASSAGKAAPRAMTKGMLEAPLLREMRLTVDGLDDAKWRQMAAGREAAVVFQPESLALMKEKTPSFTPRMLETLKTTVAQDSFRNEYDFHLRIHSWFATGQVTTFEALNERVYTELFLTPRTDPWLGLVAEDSFPAIEGGGVVTSK